MISFSQTVKSLKSYEINFYGNEFKLPSCENYAKTKLSKFLTEGKITSSCPKKGCWVKIITNSEEMFVTFKDYSFFVPKEGISGKNIIVNGKIKTDTISVSQLKHYAYDEGESEDFISKIKHPKITKSIVAEGLAIIN
jgi:hypothetical protein